MRWSTPCCATAAGGRAPAVPPAAAPERAVTGPRPLPDRPLLDWAAIEADFQGARLLRRLIDTVLASNAGVPARIAEAQAAQDRALGFVAHSLKGMGGTLHAGALRALAARSRP